MAGCDRLAKILDEKVTALGLTGKTFSKNWLPPRVVFSEGQSPPAPSSYYAFISRSQKCPKIETLRIWHASGIFGDLSLSYIEAIACGEAPPIGGGNSDDSGVSWDGIISALPYAPPDVALQIAIAALQSIDLAGPPDHSLPLPANDHQSAATIPVPATKEYAQDLLSRVFKHSFPKMTAQAIAAFLNETYQITKNPLSADRIQGFLDGEALLNSRELGYLGREDFPLHHPDGRRVTEGELMWMSMMRWYSEDIQGRSLDAMDTIPAD